MNGSSNDSLLGEGLVKSRCERIPCVCAQMSRRCALNYCSLELNMGGGFCVQCRSAMHVAVDAWQTFVQRNKKRAADLSNSMRAEKSYRYIYPDLLVNEPLAVASVSLPPRVLRCS